MKTAVLAVLMVVSISLYAHAKDKGGIGPQTDFRNMPPEQLLSLLQNAGAIKVEAPSYFDKVTLKACNGKKPGWFNSTYELSCLSVATVLESEGNNPSTVLPVMQALLRGCGLYAANSESSIGDKRSGATCGMLGTLLFALGNIPAAKIVWEQAPGCHSHDMNGHPTDGCIREIVGVSEWTSTWAYSATSATQRLHAYDSDFSRLLQMARSSCTSTQDLYACRFVSSHGDDIDMAAVEHEQAARSRAIERTQAQDQEERKEKARESDARFDAVMGALQSLPGGNDPNAVLNAGNQQAAAIRAIGDAHAARQQENSANSSATQTASLGAYGTTNGSVSGSQSNSGASASSASASPGSQPQTVAAVPQCITVQSKGDGTYTLTNFCPYAVNVSFAQAGDGLDADASLLQNETVHEGDTSKTFKMWVCPSPYSAIDLSTNHQSPHYTSSNVACAVGNAGSGS